MKRLNMLIKNKKESIGEDFLCADISADDLESSGLSALDRFHLNKWSDGLESGRHCMLALLENRSAQENESHRSQSGKGVVGAPQQRPLEMAMLSATISLPDEFLCDSGFLYESIFSRAPGAVVREAMQLLAVKALEKTSSSLRVDQINLALKQLRVEKMTANVSSAHQTSGKEKDDGKKNIRNKVEEEGDPMQSEKNKENVNYNSNASPPTVDYSGISKCPSVSSEELPPPPPLAAIVPDIVLAIDRDLELFRLQIVTELIKMHITGGRKLPLVPASDSVSTKNRSGSSSSSSKSLSPQRSEDPSVSAKGGSAEAISKDEISDKERKNRIDVDTIEEQLDCPLQTVEAIAGTAQYSAITWHNMISHH